VPLSGPNQEGITGADAAPTTFHFEVEHAVHADEDLEMVVCMAAGRGPIAAQRQAVWCRARGDQAAEEPVTPAAWACWSAW
jgi:hypothetical protein